MWSRRDQIQAYQFLRRRTISAIVVGDPNAAESPSKLTVAALVTGLLVMVLVLAGFGVAGYLGSGSSTAWKDDGAIIVEKETGARSIYGQDRRLHPVLNYVSARLLTGGSKIVSVARSSLRPAPRGATVGISGAPDALPAAGDLVDAPWTACTIDDEAAGPDAVPTVTVSIGAAPPNGARAVPAMSQFLVRTRTETHVISDGVRYLVSPRGQRGVLTALGLDREQVLTVAPQWLEMLPAGPDLAFPAVPARGRTSSAIPGTTARVGQVFVESLAGSTERRYFLLLDDGLAAISVTQARLVLGDPQTSRAYGGRPAELTITPDVLARSGSSATDLAPERYPGGTPASLSFTASRIVTCAVENGTSAGRPRYDLYVAGSIPGADRLVPVANRRRGAGTVAIPPGSGALVRSRSADGVGGGPIQFVSDQGVRYPVAGTDELKALGFGKVEPTAIPEPLVELLPIGPELSQAAAARVVRTPESGPTPTTP
jgi:type VII secretion protein EccB